MNLNIATFSCLLALAGSVGADAGDVLWHFEVPAPPEDLHRPSVGVDGTIYWSTRSLYAISPSGQQLWVRPDAAVNPVGIGLDGTLYIGGKQPPPNSHLSALKAFSPAGEHLWDFTSFGLVVGFLGGPNVGPDGNVYAVTYGGSLPDPPGFGAFSLTPGGALRWHFDGFGNDSGTPSSEIVFGNGQMYKSEHYAPMPAGQLGSGLVALEFDGDLAWRYSVGTENVGASRHPCVSPLNGNVHKMRPTRTLETFKPDGSIAWVYSAPITPTGAGTPAVGPDGSIYFVNGNQHVISLNASGSVRWTTQNVVSNTARAPEVSPDGSLLVFGTAACNGGACPGRIVGLDTSNGSVRFNKALPNIAGGVQSVTTQPRFSNDGSIVYIGTDTFFTFSKSYLLAIAVDDGGAGTSNYCQTAPNSNGSGALIGANGSTSMAANDFELSATSAAVTQPGIFFYGPTQVQLPFGNGFRCVGGTAIRLPIVQTDLFGDASFALDLTAPPGSGGQISSGDTWNFQFWFRDPLAGGANFNLSDALSAVFSD